jgi:hypothetical protein
VFAADTSDPDCPAALPYHGQALPDPDVVFRLEIELVAGLHAEGVVPSVDIAQRTVNPETRRRMGVDGGLLLERIGAVLGALSAWMVSAFRRPKTCT